MNASPHPNSPSLRPCSQADENAVARRAPSEVMRLARMGSFHASRLSFMRVVLRRLVSEQWRITRPVWKLDEKGVGYAVFTATAPPTQNNEGQVWSLVVFSHDLPDEQRSDRVIATAWDVTFALTLGVPDENTIQRLRAHVPVQEEGRVEENDWVLSRANRSVRLFNHTVERLSEGQQPDSKLVNQIGYLMRTTAVYGSGKFGLADYEIVSKTRDFFSGSFRAELLAVYLIRLFTFDIVEHLAEVRAKAHGRSSAKLAPEIRQQLGVGNSTGLGMAPFLLTHPALLGNWIMAREEALARVRSLSEVSSGEIALFTDRLERMARLAEMWQVEHEEYRARILQLRKDLKRLREEGLAVLDGERQEVRPWDALYLWSSQHLGLDAVECLVSLLFEPYPELVDGLADCMSADENAEFVIEGARTVADTRALLERFYGWTTPSRFESESANALVWYTSAEKLEPRLGFAAEGLSPYERPLATARDAMELARCLDGLDSDAPIAELLLVRPDLRNAVRRLQILEQHPYAEICDNTIDSALSPLDLLRCKLSFFGATRFDPRSDRWLRICMYQGAPVPDENGRIVGEDDWIYPPAS